MLAIADGSVVEARIEEEVAGDVFVELESESILPLYFGAIVGSETVEAGLPRDVVGEFPRQVDGGHRTEVAQNMLSLVESEGFGERQSVDEAKVVGQWRELDASR